MCSSRKYSHTHLGKVVGIPRGRGGLEAKISKGRQAGMTCQEATFSVLECSLVNYQTAGPSVRIQSSRKQHAHRIF